MADKCLQGDRPCPAPAICHEPALGSIERYEIKLDAEAAARRCQATGQKQLNPHPRGSRRNTVWTTYFLEELMTGEGAAT